MPNKHNARYDEWKIWFERYLALVADEVTLVGWSLGGMFLAKYLSEHEPMRQVSAAFVLAAPSGEFASPDGSGDDCLQFRPTSNDIVNLPQRVSHLEFWHSQDDFVVPVTELEWYRAHIPAATFRVFADKNHFLVPELPELIGAIRLIS
jgi:predicted alpha/beta hydrolase family esterase